MTEAQRFATQQEAAEYAGVTVMTIGRWIKAGRLTKFRTQIGRSRIRVDLNEIDALTTPAISKAN
jgi:excisionase family DNA binding protein